MIKRVTVNGKDVALGTSYMYGDVSVLYIDGHDTSITIWGRKTTEEARELIIDGIHALYGEDAHYTIEVE